MFLKGEPASAGIAKGTTKLILSPSDLMQVGDDNILVVPLASSQLLPAMLRAAAIVTEVGTALSQVAIVSREFGIPCVVGVEGATSAIRDGMEIIVDGTTGCIFRLC